MRTMSSASLLTPHASIGLYTQDFKPANLMLCSDGVVKIADFGACRGERDFLTLVSAESQFSRSYAGSNAAAVIRMGFCCA